MTNCAEELTFWEEESRELWEGRAKGGAGPGHPVDLDMDVGYQLKKKYLKDSYEWGGLGHKMKEFHRRWPLASTWLCTSLVLFRLGKIHVDYSSYYIVKDTETRDVVLIVWKTFSAHINSFRYLQISVTQLLPNLSFVWDPFVQTVRDGVRKIMNNLKNSWAQAPKQSSENLLDHSNFPTNLRSNSRILRNGFYH